MLWFSSLPGQALVVVDLSNVVDNSSRS